MEGSASPFVLPYGWRRMTSLAPEAGDSDLARVAAAQGQLRPKAPVVVGVVLGVALGLAFFIVGVNAGVMVATKPCPPGGFQPDPDGPPVQEFWCTNERHREFGADAWAWMAAGGVGFLAGVATWIVHDFRTMARIRAGLRGGQAPSLHQLANETRWVPWGLPVGIVCAALLGLVFHFAAIDGTGLMAIVALLPTLLPRIAFGSRLAALRVSLGPVPAAATP